MSGYFMLPAKPFPVPVIRAVLLLGCLCFPLRNIYRVLSKERFQPENDPETDDREDRNNSFHSKKTSLLTNIYRHRIHKGMPEQSQPEPDWPAICYAVQHHHG